MWCGSRNSTPIEIKNRRSKLYVNWRVKKDGKPLWPRYAAPANNWIITYPQAWKALLLVTDRLSDHHLIYFYDETYYFTLASPSNAETFRLHKSTNTIFVTKQYNSLTFRYFLSSLRHLMRTLSSIFFSKMKFKGKGYYIYKNARNTIAPQFGYFHKIYVYAFNVSVKFLSKTSVLLFGFSKTDVLTVGYDFKSKKKINIFTGRGVRFARQIVYRKTGKVSSYR